MAMIVHQILSLLFFSICDACSYVEVAYAGGNLAIGNAFEFPAAADVIPGSRYALSLHSRSAQQRFGYVGVEWQFNRTFALTIDGMNEHGLTVSLHVLKASIYQQPSSSMENVGYSLLSSWMLSNFCNVSEVIAGLHNVSVVQDALHNVFHLPAAHWAIADEFGNSAVIEYLKGELSVQEGRKQHVGVMTNDPPYDWHTANLNNYVNLRPDWPASNVAIQVQLDSGLVPTNQNVGFNLGGMPGDMSPASRFVRLFFLREYALLNNPEFGSSSQRAMELVQGLLNNVFNIKGSIAGAPWTGNALEYTPWSIIKIPSSRSFMFRTAANMQWQSISLSLISFAEGAASVPITISTEPGINVNDVTKDLQPATSSPTSKESLETRRLV